MRTRWQTQMTRNRCADVGERTAPAERAARDVRPERHDRNTFASMIAARPRGVAAVIASDDGQVVGFEQLAERRQPRIERFERGGVAARISAMAVQRVEI